MIRQEKVALLESLLARIRARSRELHGTAVSKTGVVPVVHATAQADSRGTTGAPDSVAIEEPSDSTTRIYVPKPGQKYVSSGAVPPGSTSAIAAPQVGRQNPSAPDGQKLSHERTPNSQPANVLNMGPRALETAQTGSGSRAASVDSDAKTVSARTTPQGDSHADPPIPASTAQKAAVRAEVASPDDKSSTDTAPSIKPSVDRPSTGLGAEQSLAAANRGAVATVVRRVAPQRLDIDLDSDRGNVADIEPEPPTVVAVGSVRSQELLKSGRAAKAVAESTEALAESIDALADTADGEHEAVRELPSRVECESEGVTVWRGAGGSLIVGKAVVLPPVSGGDVAVFVGQVVGEESFVRVLDASLALG